jgi:hypothetical protein
MALVRTDLQVSTDAVAVKPGLSLGSYVGFARYHNSRQWLTLPDDWNPSATGDIFWPT